MLANAVFNMYILFKYPQFEDAQRNDATSEIKGFLASNPAFASQMVSASTDAIRNNPGMQLCIFFSLKLSYHNTSALLCRVSFIIRAGSTGSRRTFLGTHSDNE
jgi:hypothetical protein